MTKSSQRVPAKPDSGVRNVFEGVTRRMWLARATAVVAAGSLSAHTVEADDRSATGAGETRVCTLGFSTYGMPNMETRAAVAALAEIGYDAVELAVTAGRDADSARLTAAQRGELRKQLQKLNVRLTSLMEHVPPTDDTQQKFALERLKLACGVAHDLSPDRPPLVQTVLGGGKWEQVKSQLRDYLGDWAALADESHVTIAIKPHRGGGLSQPAEALWLLEQLGNPASLKMVYDYSHYAFRDLPVDDTVKRSLPHTAHVVFKDAVEEQGKVVFKLPGAAKTIDYTQLLRLFFAGGYRGDFNCEVSGMVSSQPGYDPIAAARFSYQHVAAAFATAEIPRPER